MNNLLSPGEIIGITTVLLLIWALISHSPKVEKQMSRSELDAATSLLKKQFDNCQSAKDLELLEPDILKLVNQATGLVSDTSKYEQDLWNAYTVNQIHLERNCAAELLPYLSTH